MYKCKYDNRITSKYQSVIVERLDQVKDGFWVDFKSEFTTGSDCLYWIPPSRILYIEKI